MFKTHKKARSPLTRRTRVFFVTALFLTTMLNACSTKSSGHLRLNASPVPYEQAWKSSLAATRLFYEDIAIEDKQAGYFQSVWAIHKVGLIIGSPVRRSRLIGQVRNQDPYQLDVDLEQEAFSMELGRWVSDAPDQKRLAEIKERLRVRLRF